MQRDEFAVSYFSHDFSRRVFRGIGRFETHNGFYEKGWTKGWFEKELIVYGE